jgi:DNA-binding CsgD family transcriptional regulator
VESLDWSKADRAERLALLVLAEQLCVSDIAQAAQIFAMYHHVSRRDGTADVTLPNRDVVVPLAAYVGGLIHRSRGRVAKGHALIREAHIRYGREENRWRLAMALIALHETPLPSEPRSDRYRKAAARIICEHFPRSYLAGRVGECGHGQDDAIFRSLPPTRRDVLRHLLDGIAPKAIAAMKGLAEKTIRHAVADLESAFSVHSIQELVVACHRRGLSAASWPSVEREIR